MTSGPSDLPAFAPPRRNFSPWYQWMARLAATPGPAPAPGDDDRLEAWVRDGRARLAEAMGRWPEPVAPDFEVLGTEVADGYRRLSVVYDTEDSMSVPAYLLIPDGRTAPGPAVLAIHGHGPGKAVVCGLETTESPHGDYAHQLARRGFVVLAPDLRCFGQRADWNPPDHYGCDTNLVHAVMAGWNPLTQNVWDMARSLDVLAALPEVDPARLGVVGLSYGATVTLFLAALDQRVAAAVVSGYLSSWAEAHKMPWNMCGSQVLPGMLGRIEHVEVAALVAPRPLLVETGTEDLLFPLAAARQSVATLARLYARAGHPERLVHDVFEGEHQWHGELAYPFLAAQLAAAGG